MAGNSNRQRKGAATASAAKKPVMRITKRVVNTKRHTTGYIINGKYHSVSAAAKLAARDRIRGVRVVGNHIQAVNGRKRLQDLPREVRKTRSAR